MLAHVPGVNACREAHLLLQRSELLVHLSHLLGKVWASLQPLRGPQTACQTLLTFRARAKPSNCPIPTAIHVLMTVFRLTCMWRPHDKARASTTAACKLQTGRHLSDEGASPVVAIIQPRMPTPQSPSMEPSHHSTCTRACYSLLFLGVQNEGISPALPASAVASQHPTSAPAETAPTSFPRSR